MNDVTLRLVLLTAYKTRAQMSCDLPASIIYNIFSFYFTSKIEARNNRPS